MPFIKPYESSVPLAAGIQSRPAQVVGNGMGALAQGVSRFGEQRHKRQLEQDDSDLIATQARLRATLAERRQQAGLDGSAANPEWLEKEREYAESEFDKTVSKMRTDDGRRIGQGRQAILLAEETQRWIATQANASAAQQKTQLQEVEDLTLQAVQKDPSGYNVATADFLANLEGPAYDSLDKPFKEGYSREFKARSARAFLDGTEQAHGSAAALLALDTVRENMPAAQYTSLRDHFTNRAKTERATQRESEQLVFFRRVDAMVARGNNPTDAVTDAVADKLISAEQGSAIDKQYIKHVELQQKIANADAAFRIGDLVGFAAVDPAIQTQVADAWLTEQRRAYGAADPETRKQIAGGIVEKGVNLDYVFPGMKAALRASPHGENFAGVVDEYLTLKGFDPYYASKLASPDQQARFEVYSVSKRAGMSDNQALEFARSVTPERVASARKFLHSEEGKPELANMRAAVADRSGLLTGDMLNGRQAANEIIEYATLLMAGNPSAPIDDIVASAQTAYESQNMRVGNVWIPRIFLGSVPAASMPDVTTRVLRRLPELLKKNELPVLDGDYAVAPDDLSPLDGRMQVYDPMRRPIPGLRLGPVEFRAEYQRMQGEGFVSELARRNPWDVPPLTPERRLREFRKSMK